jgi:hypothetical protein
VNVGNDIGGAIVRRLRTVLLAFLLNACVYVPLPDKVPPLQEVRLPRPGDSVAEVRRVFGDPQLLHSGRFLLYDWTTDRRFVIVPLFPTGLPGGGVVSGQRFRMRIVLDDAQRVASVDCSVESLDSTHLEALGCRDPAAMRALARPVDWRELADIPELADVRFWHPEMTGTNTNMILSPDGSTLAGSDVKNRTWIVDIGSFTVVGRHANTPPNFWSWKGIPEPRAAFSADSQRLVIAQGTTISFLDRVANRFISVGQLEGDDLRVARFICCSDSLMGYGPGGAVRITLEGKPHGHLDGEGRLAFDVSGAAVTRASPSGAVRLGALDSALLAPSPRAAFGATAQENVVLDGRNDFARHRAPANFEFSPDGRWLARNSCRHLELYDSRALSERLADGEPVTVAPAQAMMMSLLDKSSQDAGCHGPIAFHPAGQLVAAAGEKAIHVWSVDEGRQALLVDLTDQRYGLHAVAIALDANYRLTAVVSDYRGTIYVARWRIAPDFSGSDSENLVN